MGPDVRASLKQSHAERRSTVSSVSAPLIAISEPLVCIPCYEEGADRDDKAWGALARRDSCLCGLTSWRNGFNLGWMCGWCGGSGH
jgi:hypothetical protein